MSGLNVRMAGQTINDRLLAARHSIAGQGLAKSVCKATTEEMIAPKKKHLDCKYIIWLVNKDLINYVTVNVNFFCDVHDIGTFILVDNFYTRIAAAMSNNWIV